MINNILNQIVSKLFQLKLYVLKNDSIQTTNLLYVNE